MDILPGALLKEINSPDDLKKIGKKDLKYAMNFVSTLLT